MNKRSKIFHLTDVIDLTRQSRRDIVVPAPKFDAVEEPVQVYTGPTVAEVRSEVRQQRQLWEQQKTEEQEQLQAQLEGQRNRTDEELESLRDEAQARAEQIVAEAEQRAQELLSQAEAQAEQQVKDAELRVEMIHQEGREQGRQEGQKEGYGEGFAEVRRLVGQLHYMISGVLQRREEIIASLESDLIDLTLLIARKVVKVLSENQKDIVIYNTLEALKKLRMRSSVTLRVNPEDMEVSQANKEYFIREVESLEGIEVVEDHLVQRGGCIVESDFGEVDARISSQLRNVEDKILSVKPVRRRSPRRLSEDIVRKETEELQSRTEPAVLAGGVSSESAGS